MENTKKEEEILKNHFENLFKFFKEKRNSKEIYIVYRRYLDIEKKTMLVDFLKNKFEEIVECYFTKTHSIISKPIWEVENLKIIVK